MARTDNVETTYPISQHLTELRKRLMYVGAVWLVLFLICYWQSKYIMGFVTAPILPLLNENAHLAMLTLIEGFMTEIKVCMLAALFFSMPFILYQGWRFIAPGLYKNEKRYVVGFVISASVLFIAGASFCYYLVFPLGFKFLLSYSGGEFGMIATLSIGWYLSLVVKMLLAFGIVFELPVVVFFLAKIGLVNTEMLRKYRKFAIVGIFALAAIITPPDVISQIAMAVPLIILYEISILITKVFGPQPEKEEKNEEEEKEDIYK